MKKILITTSSFADECPDLIEGVQKHGFKLLKNPHGRKLTEAELGGLLAEYEPVGLIAGVEPVTGAILRESVGFLQVVSRVGVGWDNVDRETAAELGIKVFRTEGVLDQAVAELTIGFILNALRNISLNDRQIRGRVWQKKMGTLLQGKTVGVIGYGAIGQKVGQLSTSFGATVVYADICEKDSPCGVCVSLEQLLAQSDIISVHASGCNGIVGKEELAHCKPGVIVVNTARGGLINEEALYDSLVSGQVAWACLDVFEKEPYDGPLARLDNVIMTSHIGSYAREARIRMEKMAVANLLQGLGMKQTVF